MTQVEKCPDPFPIPRFKADTEEQLQNCRFGDPDRRYIVRVLATMLCTYVQRPSSHDCEIVAKSLVCKHPFLKEYVRLIVKKFCRNFFVYTRTGILEAVFNHQVSEP